MKNAIKPNIWCTIAHPVPSLSPPLKIVAKFLGLKLSPTHCFEEGVQLLEHVFVATPHALTSVICYTWAPGCHVETNHFNLGMGLNKFKLVLSRLVCISYQMH